MNWSIGLKIQNDQNKKEKLDYKNYLHVDRHTLEYSLFSHIPPRSNTNFLSGEYMAKYFPIFSG